MSIVISVLSIVSKAYVVSVSFDLAAFCAKFLLIAYDIFSLFYVFSSLLSRDAPQEVDMPIVGRRVSHLANLWFWKSA
eukprot:gene44431-41946_t